MTRTFAPFTVTALFLLAATPALAQTAPDAGQILQQNREPRDAPPAPSVDLRLDGEPLTEGKAGGARVTLDTITLEGNTVFSDARLHEVLDGALGEPGTWPGCRHWPTGSAASIGTTATRSPWRYCRRRI